MMARHLERPEPRLQESYSQTLIPAEGLRILARIIARLNERKRQQLKLDAIDEDIDRDETVP